MHVRSYRTESIFHTLTALEKTGKTLSFQCGVLIWTHRSFSEVNHKTNSADFFFLSLTNFDANECKHHILCRRQHELWMTSSIPASTTRWRCGAASIDDVVWRNRTCLEGKCADVATCCGCFMFYTIIYHHLLYFGIGDRKGIDGWVNLMPFRLTRSEQRYIVRFVCLSLHHNTVTRFNYI